MVYFSTIRKFFNISAVNVTSSAPMNIESFPVFCKIQAFNAAANVIDVYRIYSIFISVLTQYIFIDSIASAFNWICNFSTYSLLKWNWYIIDDSETFENVEISLFLIYLLSLNILSHLQFDKKNRLSNKLYKNGVA